MGEVGEDISKLLASVREKRSSPAIHCIYTNPTCMCTLTDHEIVLYETLYSVICCVNSEYSVENLDEIHICQDLSVLCRGQEDAILTQRGFLC